MAEPKKGALHQVMVPMVDATDFASIESGITASDFNSGATVKFYGLNTGGSAATTSGAVSKIASLVRSGVFRITLKTTENNYDLMMLRINKTGCAEQILTWSNVDNDDSDIMSQLLLIASAASDAASAAVQGSSRILLVQSRLSDFDSRLVSDVSDIRSMLSDMMSDFQSRVPKLVATNSQLSDLHSDVRSFLVVMSGVQSDIYSALSDFQSDFGSRVPKEVASKSLLSDVNSDLASKIGAIAVVVSASDISDIASAVKATLASEFSDIYSLLSDLNSNILSRVPKEVASKSLLSDVNSDLASQIAAITVVVSASDISDIASAVRATLASDLSDILSAAQQTNSRVLVVQSFVSDIRSHVSDLQSDFQSRVPKLVATNSQVSDLSSDIKSAVENITVNLTASDISDIASAVAAAVTTINASDISDIASAVRAALISDLSDILSAAQQGNSRALVVQSHASNIYSLLSDVQSDFQSRVPKRVATDSQLSALVSDVISALAAGVPVSASDMSDIRSAIAAGNLTASDISDIASAVALVLASNLSDILSAAQQTNSRVLVIQSMASDIRSHVSDLQSDFQSRVPKLVATNSQLSDLASDLGSDLRSFIDAGVQLNASSLSDIRSAITAGGGATISASDISDIASAIFAILSSDMSDTLSAARQANSRVLLAQSQVSDIYSLLSDLHSDVGVLSGVVSDVQSALVAGVDIGASSFSDLRSAITANGVLRAGAEPTGPAGATDTLAAKMDWLNGLATHRIEQTSVLQTVKNLGNTAAIASAVVSDDGTTFVRDELA